MNCCCGHLIPSASVTGCRARCTLLLLSVSCLCLLSVDQVYNRVEESVPRRPRPLAVLWCAGRKWSHFCWQSLASADCMLVRMCCTSLMLSQPARCIAGLVEPWNCAPSLYSAGASLGVYCRLSEVWLSHFLGAVRHREARHWLSGCVLIWGFGYVAVTCKVCCLHVSSLAHVFG
jgi:hypothetical protein